MDITEPLTEHLENFPEAYYGFIYHYYRAEVYRETNWRNRLDTTTNWSIVVTAAMLSFVFSNPQAQPSIILIDYLLVWFFLYIESRRYRYYSLLRERTRIIEKQILPQIFLGKAKKLNKSYYYSATHYCLKCHTIYLNDKFFQNFLGLILQVKQLLLVILDQ